LSASLNYRMPSDWRRIVMTTIGCRRTMTPGLQKHCSCFRKQCNTEHKEPDH